MDKLMSNDFLLKEEVRLPGIWFITPSQAFWNRVFNIFRREKVKIYRNPGLDIEGDHKRKEIFWQAYVHGCTWLKEGK